VNSTYRQIIRHGAVFGAGAVLFRIASIVLLPLYTRYLTPADYGVLALLDLTINVLSIVAGAGIAAAATRAHFGDDDRVDVGCVWWTAILCIVGFAGIIVGPAIAFRHELAPIVFGAGLDAGAYYLTIALINLWIASVTTVVDAYFRAGKASTFVVGIGIFRLIVNIALNVSFVVGWRMGVAGVLWGNTLSAAAAAVVQCAPFVARHRRVAFDWIIARGFWRFGWPLIVFGLGSVAMHEADRYVLRLFVDLREVGLYAIAYQIGQGVNSLIAVPFSGIYGVLIYEIAKEPDAQVIYARVFKQYVFGLALVLSLAALFARPIIGLIAPPEYLPAADIVPIVCLAYFFFSIHDHFKVPALLASRTVALLPAVLIASGANIALNLVLIPVFGAVGAAWASVVTFVLFTGIGLVRNRRIDRYPYPFGVCTAVLTGTALTYAFHRVVRSAATPAIDLGLAAVLWLAWAGVLFGRTILANARGVERTTYATPNADPRIELPARNTSTL
jgi:O-antigen/teichoic acid export membrane protein